jgi:hypothetical protein
VEFASLTFERRTLCVAVVLLLEGCGVNSAPKQAAPEKPPVAGVTRNLPHRSAGMNYHIDNIGGALNPLDAQTIQVPAAALTVSGWAIDEPFKAVASNVDVAIDGVAYGARYGISRKDVAAFFKNPLFENSGFQFTIPASLLTPGSHAVKLRIAANDGKSYIESPGIRLQVQ